MIILGISAYYHDSAAAIISEEKIIAAAQEERFTRKKHDPSFPVNAIKYCVEESGYDLNEMDAIVFYDKPFIKFERLLETYYHFAPRGLVSFITSIPVWVREKLFLKGLIKKELKKTGSYDPAKVPLYFSEHHLSHAASAFYPSPFEEAAILTIDGVGEWSTASICHGKGNSIKILKELHFPHSVGLLYSAFTYFLGFRVNSGEYKLMGLAPYGLPNHEETQAFEQKIYDHLVEIKDDGSVWLNQKMFKYATGLRMVSDRKWNQLFGFRRRRPGDKIEQHHCNLAYAIQNVTEEVVRRMVKHTYEVTGQRNICLAGGVALNCVANGKILEEGLADNIFIQPAAGDAGGALGAAYTGLYILGGKERHPVHPDAMQGAYLGPEYSNSRIQRTLRRLNADYRKYNDSDELINDAAEFISRGEVVGWFQGRMEYGPRALGNRSILADARNPEMQKKLNLKIKYRESFRPFAPSTLEEDMNAYYDLRASSPYMLLVGKVKDQRRKQIPDHYNDMAPMERLYIERSDVPAVTHMDFTARVQSVSKDTNERYWRLIHRFKELTGHSTIINTSFNVRGEPIVRNPEEAYICFMNTEMDVLVLGDCLLKKSDQPAWDREKKIQKFKPD
ncbi:MAG: carbamoyltransferase [Bacteroidales bacterium]|nr:carbamoyltransferase [Bacteroidales bacterium]